MPETPLERDRRAGRPAVSVVIPFAGDEEAAHRTVRGLERLDLGPGDEVLVVDNSPAGSFAAVSSPEPVRVLSATAQLSSYYARNAGAEQSSRDWVLFLDDDCLPARDLLLAYLWEVPPPSVGILSGSVLTVEPSSGRPLAMRWALSRERDRFRFHAEEHPLPAGGSGNMLVRRAAWDAVGGFQEGVRSAADIEFCWRVQQAGWDLARRERAIATHAPVARVSELRHRSARHGAGRVWISRRYRGWWPRPRFARELARGLGGALVWAVALRFERAALKLVDLQVVAANAFGSLGSNRAPREHTPRSRAAPERRIAVMTDAFPALPETFIAAEVKTLIELGWDVRVEASARPAVPDRQVARDLGPCYSEDDSIIEKARDLVRLLLRHPLGCLRDLLERRRWRRQEPVWPLSAIAPAVRRLERRAERHIHIHFAAGAALNAMRVARLAGVPYSLTAHAYDIYREPANLAEKLRRAAFVTSGCDYTVRDLRRAAGDEGAPRIEKVVMGVDPERFRRTRPYPGGRTVLAIGRLVPKKGFADLIEACALLAARGAALDRLAIAGDGPLREELVQLASERGVAETVELLGWRSPAAIRELLEETDLLAMPCVVAPDGDRDSMPVVVKEALAMEVPVVATREVGLPEVVTDEWGRLVAPGAPAELAAAVAELLELSSEKRSRMGRAGRAFVIDQANVERETERLGRLLEAAMGATKAL